MNLLGKKLYIEVPDNKKMATVKNDHNIYIFGLSSLGEEGSYEIGSVSLSVCLSVCQSVGIVLFQKGSKNFLKF